MDFRNISLVLAMTASTIGMADEAWNPVEGDWQLDAVREIQETFGLQSFDELIWANETTLWAIRPSFGIQQNLLANTVCRSIERAGQPAGSQISLIFFDTDAYRKGSFEEHASVKCLAK